MPPDTAVIVCAHNEADRLPATLAALRTAFPGAPLIVADDASTDGTADAGRVAGAQVVTAPRRQGKGGTATLAARAALEHDAAIYVLCDGDLAESAAHLSRLTVPVRDGQAGMAVAAFERKVGGGFGLALRFARWAIERRASLRLRAPISGQRALSPQALRAALPFAPRFGMEIGMTVDVARAGFAVVELELPLAHRATGRSWRGFVHRGRQLRDFLLVYLRRRG
jgi:glycosyltransferase involved in cell wall biosynthesis